VKVMKLLVAGMLVMLALTGCVTKGPSMPPDEARDSLTTLFGETQKLVGGTWESVTETGPSPCDQVSGGKGVQFIFGSQTGSPGTNADAKVLAAKVAELWRGKGYKVKETFETELGYQVDGENDEHSSIGFGANFRAMSLLGGSNCVPGNIDDLLD
jgi:predicted small lipoprotein YifL